MTVTEDRLIIGYDYSNEKDHTCLLVSRLLEDNTFLVLNEFWDEEAEYIHKKLTGKAEGRKCMEMIPGYKLLENIAKGEIKQGTLIDEYLESNFNEHLILNTTIQEKDTKYELYNNHLYDSRYMYKIVEESKGIEELNYYDISSAIRGKLEKNIHEEFKKQSSKINELVRAINILKKGEL